MDKRIELHVIERMIQPTSNIIDKHLCLAALAYGKQRGVPRKDVVKIILAKKRQWLEWLTITQRKWQCQTKNHNKARHSDSVKIREEYVRCR